MNINFLVEKEKERVVVSNQKGTMNPREYQDNIEEILIKEDVVEELESKYSALKINRTSLKGRLENTNQKLEKNFRKRKSFISGFLVALVGIPAYIVVLEYLINMNAFQIGFIEIKTLIYSYLLSSGMVAFIGGFLAISPDKPFFERRRLKKEKEEFEKCIEEVDLEIAALVQVITKNKAELDELREQKEKNNIDRMPIDVQQISYREALEQELSYLTQLREETKADEQEETEKNNSILGRFKKKKR